MYVRPTLFDTGVGKYLPKAYQKFYWEWQEEPTPVHYIPKAGKYVRNEETGITTPVQNVPLPLKYPKEFDKCLLGGEAVIKGYYKSRPTVRRFPNFWVPTIKRTTVYSEILNQHMDVLATDRVQQLIHHYKGFDEYIMQVNLFLLLIRRKWFTIQTFFMNSKKECSVMWWNLFPVFTCGFHLRLLYPI